MKILLIGKNGQIGWELRRTLAPMGTITALGRKEMDLSDEHSIRRALRSDKYDLIVNAAAYTAVDRAEEESDLAMAVNAIAPGIMAEEASLNKSFLIHYSTDYVFDGQKNEPYSETDPAYPQNVYGKTKLAGEEAIRAVGSSYLILRTGWVYGLRGNNFLLKIMEMARQGKPLKIVNDQYGAPSWCRMIAEATATVVAKTDLKKRRQDVFHLTAAGLTTWYGFTEAILDHCTSDLEFKSLLEAIRTGEFPVRAKRPAYSLLDNSLIQEQYGIYMPPWEKQLQLAMASD